MENWWGDAFSFVEGVPAWVCQSCGERYFDPDVVQTLNDLAAAHPEAQRSIVVPVYGFPERQSSQ